MSKVARLQLKTANLKEFISKVEEKVRDIVPESTLKRVEVVRKEVVKQLSKLEHEAQERLRQTLKLLRVPTKNERVAARRARVNVAAKTFGLVTEDEFQKLQKKVNSMKKQLSEMTTPVSSRSN